MEIQGLALPPSFLATPGTPIIPWNQWSKLFINYMLACDATAYSNERKKAMLLHALGAEGQRTFHTLTEDFITVDDDDTCYTKAMKMLKSHYAPTMNVVVERYNFRKGGQLPGEGVDSYITSLRELIVTCEYGTMADEMIRDQLVEKTNSCRVRDRLLLVRNLTLTKAIEVARQTEQAIKEAKSLTSSSSDMKGDTVQQVRVRPNTARKAYYNFKRPDKKHEQQFACYRCGSKEHKANNDKCPARHAKCPSCFKIGHYASVCRSSASSKVHHVDEDEFCSDDEGYDPDPEYVLTVTQPYTDDEIYVHIQIGGAHELKMMVDTGSKHTLIPESVYKKIKSPGVMSPPDVGLCGYGNNPIKVRGYFTSTLTYNGRTAESKIYVTQGGTPILGRKLFRLLLLQIHSTTDTSYVMHTVENEAEFSDVLNDKLGTAKRFTHHIKLKADATPVQHSVRNVPLAVREPLSEEIQRLCDSDVIEKIESSEWVSQLLLLVRLTTRFVCVLTYVI